MLNYLENGSPSLPECSLLLHSSPRGAPALLRIAHPTTPAISEAVKIPSLAVSSSEPLAKARSEMNNDMVKPMPASQPAP